MHSSSMVPQSNELKPARLVEGDVFSPSPSLGSVTHADGTRTPGMASPPPPPPVVESKAAAATPPVGAGTDISGRSQQDMPRSPAPNPSGGFLDLPGVELRGKAGSIGQLPDPFLSQTTNDITDDDPFAFVHRSGETLNAAGPSSSIRPQPYAYTTSLSPGIGSDPAEILDQPGVFTVSFSARSRFSKSIPPRTERVEDKRYHAPLLQSNLWIPDEELAESRQEEEQRQVARMHSTKLYQAKGNLPLAAPFVPYFPKATKAEELTYVHTVEEPPLDPAFNLSSAEVHELTIDNRTTRSRVDRSLKEKHLLAYDDGDPFNFPQRQIPPPIITDATGAPLRDDITGETLPPLRVRHDELEIFVLSGRVLMLSRDRTKFFSLRTEGYEEGWMCVFVRGFLPPHEAICTLVRDSLFVAFDGDTFYFLDFTERLQKGWIRRKMYEISPVAPLWVHPVINTSTLYVKTSDKEHQLLEVAADTVHGGHYLITQKELRSKPVQDTLVGVQQCHSLALSFFPDHTWIFRYEQKARNFLPMHRIECVNPKVALSGSHCYLFAQDRPGVYSTAGPCVRLMYKFPVDCSGVEEFARGNGVILMISLDEVASFCTHGEQCVMMMLKNLETCVILEVDRWERVKRYFVSMGD